jgi:UDP-N-acetyl-D-mannosaminuronate dehydrogenase
VADLVGRGIGVTVVDPLVENWTMTPTLPIEELTGSIKCYDLVVVVTNHPDFDFEKVGREARMVLDTRNAVRPSETVVPL